jgi:hypothetical protein
MFARDGPASPAIEKRRESRMMKQGMTTKLLATALVVSLQAPLVGARLHVGDPKSGEVFSSGLTTEDGEFLVANLPAATYQLAVESNNGLYLVGTPVKLAPGQTRHVNVAVNPDTGSSPSEKKEANRKGIATLWNNPATAGILVIGFAVIVGALVDRATKDELEASPSS